MVFNENYYKEKNIDKTLDARIKHHDTEMRRIAKEANYKHNPELHDLAHEHFMEYTMLKRYG